MNFLNKKYTNRHSTSQYSNSNNFMPSSSTVREVHTHVMSQSNCELHPNQIIRNFCVECVELLCAECIGQHLQLHREANIIPKIYSIKQMRAEMEQKIDYINDFMHQNSPQKIEIQSIKKKALDKIDDMRKDLVRAIDQWVNIMRGHLLTNLGFDEISKMKHQMEKLSEEILMLKSAMLNNNQPSVVKKIFQIDGQKLQEGYVGMFKKYKQLLNRSQFEFNMNWKEIIKSLQAHIIIKGKQEVLVEEEQYTPGGSSIKQAAIQKENKSKTYEYRQ